MGRTKETSKGTSRTGSISAGKLPPGSRTPKGYCRKMILRRSRKSMIANRSASIDGMEVAICSRGRSAALENRSCNGKEKLWRSSHEDFVGSMNRAAGRRATNAGQLAVTVTACQPPHALFVTKMQKDGFYEQARHDTTAEILSLCECSGQDGDGVFVCCSGRLLLCGKADSCLVCLKEASSSHFPLRHHFETKFLVTGSVRS